MENVKIAFAEKVWENPRRGVYQKIFTDGNRRIRVLRFEYGFVEHDWCTKGHIGYVLSGKMTIDFNGVLKTFSQGDGLWIEAGEACKHKVIIKEGEMAELVRFEEEN